MSKSDHVRAEVLGAIYEVTHLKIDDLDMAASIDTLVMDSLDFIELILDIEERLKISIPDAEVVMPQTISSFIADMMLICGVEGLEPLAV